MTPDERKAAREVVARLDNTTFTVDIMGIDEWRDIVRLYSGLKLALDALDAADAERERMLSVLHEREMESASAKLVIDSQDTEIARLRKRVAELEAAKKLPDWSGLA